MVSSLNFSPDTTDSKDGKKILALAISFLVAMEIFGVCLQEVHIHGMELRPLHRHFELPIIMAAADTISLLIMLKIESFDGLMKHAEGLIVTFISHMCVEYLFNFWYIYSRNDSFAVGYFEPVMLIFLLKVCTKSECNIKMVAILTFMSLCAGLTSGQFGILMNTNRNGIIIFLLILFLSMRNIGLKRLHEENVFIKVRRTVAIPYAFSVIFIALVLSTFHLTFWALPVMFAIISMFASVSTLYVTSALLEHMHVISIAVLSLISQICVNVVCIPVEHGHNIVISIAGVLVLVSLIMLYFRMYPGKDTQEVLQTTG